MNIIVVDDDLASLQDIIVKIRMTAKPEDQVYGFTDPRNMLEAVRDRSCDVVFMKVEMQAMSGLAAAEKVKQIWPRSNIIFASEFDRYMKSAFDMRCSGYLMKPISGRDILSELENLRFA